LLKTALTVVQYSKSRSFYHHSVNAFS